MQSILSIIEPIKLLKGSHADTAKTGIPDNVLRALYRMCTPLHESRLSGFTAEADAHSMKVIRDYVLATRASEAAPTYVDLQNLADKLLAPREIVRNKEGWLYHPDYPVCDEGVRADKFLDAFGIESHFVGMDGDADEAFVERYFDDSEADCTPWTPTPPEGGGWMLLEIYPTEDGPYALFARRKTEVIETNRQRRQREQVEALAARNEPMKITFPTVLRKMWSGTEVQAWLDDLPPLYVAAPVVEAAPVAVGDAIHLGRIETGEGNEAWVELEGSDRECWRDTVRTVYLASQAAPDATISAHLLDDLRRKIAAAPRRQFESAPGVYTSWLDQDTVLDILDAAKGEQQP